MPNPRKGLTSDYDYIGVKDIEGASPKKIMGVINLSFSFLLVYRSPSKQKKTEY